MKISNEKMVIHAERLSCRFLFFNESLKELHAANLENVDYDFLFCNERLKELHAPNLRSVGYYFLQCNTKIDKSKYRALE